MILCSCDYTEIEDLAIITGMIIDYKDNNYEVTSEILESTDKSNIRIITNTCSNINLCMYKLSKVLNKEIFISHLKTLILTESTIMNNDDYYDYFLRDTKSKMNFSIYYIDDKYKDKILDIYRNDNGSSLYIKTLSDINHKDYSSSTQLNFLDLINNNIIVYPTLIVLENNDTDLIVLSNPIILTKDKKITLSTNNAIYYNLIKNKLNKTIIDIPCDNNNFSLIVDNSKTNYSFENNTLSIKISIKSNINSYNCDYNLNDTNTIKLLSDLSNKLVNNQIEELINISKENNIDLLDISSYIYKHTKKEININDINVNISVNTIINSLGETKNEYKRKNN